MRKGMIHAWKMMLGLLLACTLAGCGISSSGNAPQAEYQAENEFMQAAINEARKGIHSEEGGPIGAVVVKDGTIVGKGHDTVLAEDDATAHAELAAIRNAEKKLGTRNLSDCQLYTTAAPCMMCISAAELAGIGHIYYGCGYEDKASIGMERAGGAVSASAGTYMEQLDYDACLQLFREYTDLGIEQN